MLSMAEIARLTRELRPRETAVTGWESNQTQDMAALLSPGFKSPAGPKALELPTSRAAIWLQGFLVTWHRYGGLER